MTEVWLFQLSRLYYSGVSLSRRGLASRWVVKRFLLAKMRVSLSALMEM